MRRSVLTVAVTAGDPCGVGPEVILKALAARAVAGDVRVIVIGDHAVFAATAKRLRRSLPPWRVAPAHLAAPEPASSRFIFLDCGHETPFRFGHSFLEAGKASLSYLNYAVVLWRRGAIDAVITAPVTKWAIARSLPTFAGQTEYLASAMGAREVAMMFVSQRLRVVLLTRHVPLQRVPQALTPSVIRSTLRLTARALRTHFGIPRPRLAFCGLNPHAGEAGRCGDEEAALIAPLLRRLRADGIVCEGPFAADGWFAQQLSPSGSSGPRRRRYDAVVCAYHDQGLIPFKMVARDAGCQLTVGLPLIRTSPDHGSALDIAGKGIAHPGSMIYALQLAARLARASGRAGRSPNRSGHPLAQRVTHC